MFQSNKLSTHIFKFLALNSIIIIIFLWFFQVIFIDSYYEYKKIKELLNIINDTKKNYGDNDFYENLEMHSIKTGTCIQLIENNKLTYDSSLYNRSCIIKNENYTNIFIKSLLNEQTFKFKNNLNNEVLIKAVKLDNNTFIFLSNSLKPIDNTIDILIDQLVIVSIFVLIISLIIGYFISKKISKPIEKINSTALLLKSENYDNIEFKIDDKIEELETLVETLNMATTELSKTDKLQKEILANVSHDLKTPLTMIKAYAEMTRDLKTNKCENMNIIIEEVDRLNNLVNDIMEITKINNGELNISEFDLVELTKKIIKRFKIYDCKIELIGLEKYIINSDIKRIEQAMYNLIINAINHVGEDNLVIINIDKRVEIIDHGKGIKKEELNNIWKRYYKADKTYKRSSNGTGIGLSIVESIFKKHNIKYGVESKEKEGTMFWFII